MKKEGFSVKRALRFVECRQLPLQERISIQTLYSFTKSPILLSPPHHHHVYVALNKKTPLASIVANDEQLEAFHSIQLSQATYNDRHVFRGLLNRITYERSRETKHPITYYLQEHDTQNQDKFRVYEAAGFQYFHQTKIYRLPLIPCEKNTHKYWTLELMNYAKRAEWLVSRNTYSHTLPEAVPMTDERFAQESRQQTLFYTLKWCQQPIGFMKVRLHMYHLSIQEMHLECEAPQIREAISFLQHKFFYGFRYIDEAQISATSLQPDLTYALRQHGAQVSNASSYVFTQEVPPTPIYS